MWGTVVPAECAPFCRTVRLPRIEPMSKLLTDDRDDCIDVSVSENENTESDDICTRRANTVAARSLGENHKTTMKATGEAQETQNQPIQNAPRQRCSVLQRHLTTDLNLDPPLTVRQSAGEIPHVDSNSSSSSNNNYNRCRYSKPRAHVTTGQGTVTAVTHSNGDTGNTTKRPAHHLHQ